jgi:hypothetical protein
MTPYPPDLTPEPEDRMTPPRRRFHLWHRDPNWRIFGAHRYEQCRCGARRTTLAYANRRGPEAPDWPSRRDCHGVDQDSSGWQHGDWKTTGYPDSGIRFRKDHPMTDPDCPDATTTPASGHPVRSLPTTVPLITDQDGLVTVTWPHGRAWTAVSPDVIEGWAAQVNDLRAQVETLTGQGPSPCEDHD